MAEDGLLQMEGIIYDYSSLYSGLVSAITSQLMIDANIHNIEIKYIVSDRCPPVSIHNDVGVRIFLDQNKSNVDFFTKYPLCITLKNIAIDNQDSVVVVDRRHSDVSRTLTNFDLYSSNSIRLIGVNLDRVVDENTDEGNGVISDLSNLFIAENQIYNDKETLMEVMRHYGVVEKFRFLVTRSSSSCYYLKCPADNCSWMMNSSCLNQSKLFKIRKYCAEHTCSVRDRVYARRQGITDVVAVLIMDKFINPSTVYTPKDISEDVLKVHDVALTYMQAWRAKEKAIKLVRGDPAESYAKLPGHILPLAYAIVDSENDASWTWFFEQFREAYGERDNMCFLSETSAYGKGLPEYILDWNILLAYDTYAVIPSTVDMHVVVDGPKRLKNFQDTYAIPVEPIPCESTWDILSYVLEPKLMPPGPNRAAGRPQLERWKGFADMISDWN
ncbi:uncharacterized protein LOC125831844 [Solanum verrucosum]|uniref:uncharacterized protein LOC125831844 n=1 Tax=Solanum verrucosum TaxID=315347 RepID=UPI0020D1C9FD|nr:uncharacterized protein LOC125831844 [Solanum verrucosum]